VPGHADVIDIPVVPREPILRVVVGRVLLPSSQLAALANHGYLAGTNGCRPEAAKGAFYTMSMTPEEPHHHEESPARDPERGSGLVGFAAIKYVAIVVIVIAILVFLALYVIPALTD
jgi:hypothetical protein